MCLDSLNDAILDPEPSFCVEKHIKGFNEGIKQNVKTSQVVSHLNKTAAAFHFSHPGEAFLKAKAKEEGVVKLNSGLLYKAQ